MGPGLKGLFSREKMNNGKKPTDATVRERIDEGGQGMPADSTMARPGTRSASPAAAKP